MARSVGMLSTYLTEKLSNEDEELSKRLEVARVIFTSVSVPILRKEELVLQWLCEIIYVPDNVGEEVKSAISCLKTCLTSQRMKSLSGEIRPSVTHSLLMVLASVTQNKFSDSIEDLQECIVAVLESHYYQHWLSRDTGAFSCLLKNYFESLKTARDLQQVLKVLPLLATITKQCILRQELRKEFIDDIFIPLSNTVVLFENNKDLRDKVQSTIYMVLLYEPLFLPKVLTAFHTKQESYDTGVKELVTTLKKLTTTGDHQKVGACYTLFLKAVIQFFKEDHNAILQTFSILCTYSGITTKSIKSVTLKPLKNWSKEQSFSVIKEMVRLLDENNMPLKTDLGGVGLQDWFTCLLMGVVSLHVKDLTPELLGLVRSIVEFNPLVVENGVRALTMIMLQKKETEEIKKEYALLMKSVFSAALSVQRFQKFVSKSFPLLQEIMKFSCDDHIRLDDILPAQVSNAFGENIISLPHQQLLQLMKTFLFHLECDGLNKLENEELVLDASLKIPIQIISEMLCQFLKADRLIRVDLPDVVKEKFNSMIFDLEELLGKLGSSLLFRSHDDELLRCYLNIVMVNGNLKLWVSQKEGDAHKETDTSDLSPTNLCYLHPYVSPNHWVLINKRVENHNHGPTKDIYFSLLEQKMLAVEQVEVGEEGPGTQAGRYILENAPKQWLIDHTAMMASLLETKELLILARKLVQKHTPQKDIFFANRRWSIAVMLVLLQRMASHIQKNIKGGGISHVIVSKLDPAQLVEAELAQLLGRDGLDEDNNVNIACFLTPLQAALSSPKSPPPSERLSISTELEVLNSMPVNHFGSQCQSFLACTIIALLYDLPPDETYDKYLYGIFTKVLEGSENKLYCDILGDLSVVSLIRFLSARGVNYPLLHHMMKNLIQLCLTISTSAVQLIGALRVPNSKTLWITTLAIQIIKKKKGKHLFMDSDDEDGEDEMDNDDEFVSPPGRQRDKREFISAFALGCTSVLTKETPSKSLLRDFTIVYKWASQTDFEPIIFSLKPLLSQYLKISLENFDKGWVLMDAVMKKKESGEFFTMSYLEEIWLNLVSLPPPLPTKMVESHLYIFSRLSAFELSRILKVLLTLTIKEVEKYGMREDYLEKWFWLWSEVISSNMSSEKDKIRQANLVALIPVMLLMYKNSTSSRPLKPLLEFVSKLSRTLSVDIQNTVLDCFLEILWCIPRQEDTMLESINHLTLTLEAMFALYLFRTSLMADRIPVLFHRYRKAISTLASISPDVQDEEIINSISSCAHKIEKAASVMAKKKEFRRIAPYFIADILKIMADHTVFPSIKGYLSNTLQIFFFLCDQHGILFLTHNLPSASQEIFKVQYEDFKKNGEFKGNI